MAWRTLATSRRRARRSRVAGDEGREKMKHTEFGCLPQLHSSEVLEGSRRERRGG
jgi:hypothetical protein